MKKIHRTTDQPIEADGIDRSVRQRLPPLLLTAVFCTFCTTQLRGDELVQQTLHEFSQPRISPSWILIEAPDGGFYCTTELPMDYSGPVAKIGTDGQIAAIAGFPNFGGLGPENLLLGTDGALYGMVTAQSGGGSTFRLTPDGVVSTLYTFPSTNGPIQTSLVQGSDGDLYGTANGGGAGEQGIIFKLTTDGRFSQLIAFDGTNGLPPLNLVYGSDGSLFGITPPNGIGEKQSFIRLSADGTLTTLYVAKDGESFDGTLLQGTDGNLYGTRNLPGAETLFKLTLQGEMSTAVQFPSSYSEVHGLIQGRDGQLFGTAIGTDNTAIVFQIASDGAVQSLQTFTNGYVESLVQGRNGHLYCTGTFPDYELGELDNGELFELTTNGILTVTPLLPPSGGLSPRLLIEGGGGSIYGFTGGEFVTAETIFEIAKGGTFRTLVDRPTDTLGSYISKLFMGSDGNLLGTTGAGSRGSIFRMTADGVLSILFSFDGTNSSGPGDLIQSGNGDLIVLTGESPRARFGTISKLASDGNLTNLAVFNGTNGGMPRSLILGRNGDYYGTTQLWPDTNELHVLSTVFKLTPSGSVTTLLSMDRFDGVFILNLVQATDGDLYGIITSYRDSNVSGNETVFRLSPGGTFTNIASIENTYPYPSGLFEGSDGSLYLLVNGDDGLSAQPTEKLFRMAKDGALSRIFSWDGFGSVGDIIMAADGNFYGVSTAGQFGGGSVFRLVHPPILKAQALPGAGTSLSWNSFSNGLYRVEYKSSLEDINWSVLTSDVTAAGAAASVIDKAGAGERYYRVRLLP